MCKKEIRFYEIAGVKISMATPDFKENERLSCFRCEPCEADVIYDVEFAEKISSPAGEPAAKKLDFEIYQTPRRTRLFRGDCAGVYVAKHETEDGKFHKVTVCTDYKNTWGSYSALKSLDLPYRMLFYEALFLHASYIERNGRAILFSGDKQVGKSTQANNWQVYRNAEIVNGDRAVLRKFDGIWHACGSPYCGTSNISKNKNLPIEAIVILSKGDKNNVSLASPKEAVLSLMNNCTFEAWDSEQVERILEIAEHLVNEVLFVKLSCTPDESAVQVLEKFLDGIK